MRGSRKFLRGEGVRRLFEFTLGRGIFWSFQNLILKKFEFCKGMVWDPGPDVEGMSI